MNRRKLVSLCGTAGLASLAGCQAFGSTLEEEPPKFEEVSLSGPSEATVGDSVSLTVSVTNAGGQTGDFVDSLTVEGAADADTAVHVEEVPPSESRTVEIGPYLLGHAGDHRFALADDGASHSVSVSAPTLRAGEPFTIPDGPEVTVADATPYASLFYDRPDATSQDGGSEETDRRVLTPDGESVFVTLQTSVTNRGQQSVQVGPSSFEVADGEVVASLGPDGKSLDPVSGPDGDPFSEGSIAPGESRSGWLLAEVPRATVESGLGVAWNRPWTESQAERTTRAPSGTTAESQGRETTESRRSETAKNRDSETTESQSRKTTESRAENPPEVHWTFDPAESPSFEVPELSLLDATEFGSSATATATVQNAGAVSSTYRGVLERQEADETGWTPLATFERELAPGASASVAAEVPATVVGRAEYRLRPGSSTTASMTVNPAERALGEEFTTPAGAAVRVEVGTDAFDGLFTSYIYEDLNNQTVRAGDGHTFAFVHVTVENTAEESISFPSRQAFSVAVAGETSSVFHSSSSKDVTFKSPVEGPWYAPESAGEPGGTYSGWLVFQVPAEATVADLTVRWSPTEDKVATWSA